MENFKYKLIKLTEISQGLLAKLLTFETDHYLTDRQFRAKTERNRQFTTSRDVNKAIVTYINHNPPIIEQMRTCFYSTADVLNGDQKMVKQGLVIKNLDVAVLSLMLLNISQFEFSFAEDGHPTRSGKCSSPSHQYQHRCCTTCTGKHTDKGAYCEHCYMCEFLCKDGSFKCCSQCANCVNCNKSQATAPCINNEVRNAINIISVMRNMLSHDDMVNCASNTKPVIPTEFKFWGNTIDQLWDSFKNAYIKIAEYLKCRSKRFDEQWYKEEKHYIACLDCDTKGTDFLRNQKQNRIDISTITITNNQKATFKVHIVLKKRKKETIKSKIFRRWKLVDEFDLTKGIDSKIVGKEEPSLSTLLRKSMKLVANIADDAFGVECLKAYGDSREITFVVTVMKSKATQLRINEEFLVKLSTDYKEQLKHQYKLEIISTSIIDNLLRIKIEK